MLRYAQRTAPAIVRALLGQRGELISRVERRVGLRDLDTNLHMNQAVYAQVTELGRIDWVIRSGAMRRWREDGVRPVVASQRIVYRRELKLGARYTIDTRALGMNGRLLEIQSNLIVGERVHARCDVELIFPGNEGVLDADAAAQQCSGLHSPTLAVENWRLI